MSDLKNKNCRCNCDDSECECEVKNGLISAWDKMDEAMEHIFGDEFWGWIKWLLGLAIFLLLCGLLEKLNIF